ncbi:MAG: ammonium transporter [Akkermansiaceae bacterium]
MTTNRKSVWALLLTFFLSAGFLMAEEESTLDTGDTAWMLTATVLVLLMTLPGLALFYGGLVRSKNILSILVQCFAMAGVMSIIWVVFGYAIAAGDAQAGGLWGWNSDYVMLGHVTENFASGGDGSIPESVWVTFQMTFIIITPALIVGAFAERMKFSAMLIFSIIWTVFSYLPAWHQVWNGGFLHGGEEGNFLFAAGESAVDFAGGNVVHINAGIAGLVACIFLGRRKGYPGPSVAPHNVPFVLIGASLLWVGWFGFNAGSAGGASGSAGMAMLTTQVATASAVVVWAALEWIISKKPTAVGVATGAVAGLVAITPASGSTTVAGALIIGAVSSLAGYFMVTKVKHALKYDDSLDVFGVHGIGGIVGALLTGVFLREGYDGSFIIQLKAVLFTVVWSGVVSVIALFIAKVVCGGLRVSEEVEHAGLDVSDHGEEAYHSEGH